jgi:hypothetical protein
MCARLRNPMTSVVEARGSAREQNTAARVARASKRALGRASEDQPFTERMSG